jgi:hypothetical protein
VALLSETAAWSLAVLYMQIAHAAADVAEQRARRVVAEVLPTLACLATDIDDARAPNAAASAADAVFPHRTERMGEMALRVCPPSPAPVSRGVIVRRVLLCVCPAAGAGGRGSGRGRRRTGGRGCLDKCGRPVRVATARRQ